MRVLSQLISSKWRSYDAARGIAAALVSMQAARLLPGSTRSAAEPTTGTTAAAASADTDEHDRVCLGGLGPCPLLLKATSEHERQQMAHPEAARDVHGLLICRTPLTALVHATPVGSGSEGLLYLPCAVPVAADLEQMTQSERHCSGSGSDASRSAIARVDSKCG